MAELNFGLLTPPGSENIGNAFVRGQDQARAAQMQDMQMQQSMRQGQREELQYKKMQAEEDNLNKFYSNVAENGGPKDPIAMEDQMIGSKVPHYVQLGYTLKTKRLALEQDRKRYAEANAPGLALGGVAPMAPAQKSFGAELAAKKEQLFGPPPDSLNMMPGAAIAPADVNTLPATVAPQGGTPLDALRARINANLALGTDQGNKTAETLQKQLTEATRLYPLGNVLMSGTGAIVGTAPEKPSAPPNMVAEYTFSKTPDGGGFRGSFQDFVTARAAAGRAPRPEAAPRTQQVTMLDGTLGIMNMDTGAITAGTMGGKPVQGKSTAEKALTESQGNATAYGLRMKEAESILEELAKQGVLRGAMVEAIPFIGNAAGKALPSDFMGTSQQQQQVNQAKSNFITAVLRKESGAVISDSEFAREDEKYFPQVNDGPGVIKQKANARRLAIEAMKFQAGPGAKEIDKYVPNQATGKTSSTLSEPPPGAVRPRGSR